MANPEVKPFQPIIRALDRITGGRIAELLYNFGPKFSPREDLRRSIQNPLIRIGAPVAAGIYAAMPASAALVQEVGLEQEPSTNTDVEVAGEQTFANPLDANAAIAEPAEVQPGATMVDASSDTTVSLKPSCAPLSTFWLSNLEFPTYSGVESRNVDGFQINAPVKYQDKIAEALAYLRRSPDDYTQVIQYLKGVTTALHKNRGMQPTVPGAQVIPDDLLIQSKSSDYIGTFPTTVIFSTYGIEHTPTGVQNLAVALRSLSNGSRWMVERPLGKCYADITRTELYDLNIESTQLALDFAIKAGLHPTVIQRQQGILDSTINNPPSR